MADSAINDVGHFLEVIYTRFVLRDLIGKVIPGVFCLFGISASLYGWHHALEWVENRKAAEYVCLFAAGWLSTISLQWLGEAFWLIRYGWAVPRVPWLPYKDQVKNKVEENEKAKDKKKTNFEKFKDDRVNLNRFLVRANDDQKAVYERFVVIKEAAGNTATALSVVLVASTARYLWKNFHDALYYSPHDRISHRISLICGLIAVFGLERMYSEHRLRQRTYAEITANQPFALLRNKTRSRHSSRSLR